MNNTREQIAGALPTNQAQAGSNRIIIRVGLIAALAGLLFGLDIAYVNGSLVFISREFHLSVAQEGNVAAFLLAGAAVGALFSGWISRMFGRKKVLVTAALIFTLATLLAVAAGSFTLFLAARFVIGLGVGVASFVAPLYLSEIAPHKIRGALIALYQLMITIGIFLMFLSNASLAFTGSWRLMLLVLIVPSVIMLIGTLTLPESPRWLALVGRADQAQAVLQKIRRNAQEVSFELNEILAAAKNKTSGLKLLSRGYFIKVVLLGILLQGLQQFSGMNALMYYSGQIFSAAGFHNPAISTVIIGLVNVLTTLIAIKWVDKIGRKPIMHVGLSIVVISCAVIGSLFWLESRGAALSSVQQAALLVFCLTFIFGFAVSLGPIIWILCAEIFPLEGRDLGMTVSTMANWIFNTAIGKFTLVWFATMGVGVTFWLFGVICLLGFILICFFTPETKDVPLEELEMNLRHGQPLRNLGKRTTLAE